MLRYMLACLMAASLFLTGCDNELDLVAEWKEIPVVYGFLSPTDTAQYIRVEKAFLDEKTGALDIARIPDSLYFPNIQVQLEDAVTGQRFALQRVEGAAEGYPRQSGVFAESPNYLYKIRTDLMPLMADRTYRLLVTAEDGRMITTAETKLVGAYEMQFSSPPNPISFRYDNAVRVTWTSTETSARFYDARMRLYYDEYTVGNPGSVPKVLDWKLESGLLRGDNQSAVTIFVPGIDFFRILQSQLEALPYLSRKFKYVEIVVDAGGSELYEYVSVAQANTGITGAEYITSYSNISNGIGLFGSRSRLVAPNYFLNPVTLDSLKNGIYTRELNFF